MEVDALRGRALLRDQTSEGRILANELGDGARDLEDGVGLGDDAFASGNHHAAAANSHVLDRLRHERLQRHPRVVAVLRELAGQPHAGRGRVERQVLPEDRPAFGNAEAGGQREPVQHLPVADDLVVPGPAGASAFASCLLGLEASPGRIDESLGLLESKAVALVGAVLVALRGPDGNAAEGVCLPSPGPFEPAAEGSQCARVVVAGLGAVGAGYGT